MARMWGPLSRVLDILARDKAAQSENVRIFLGDEEITHLVRRPGDDEGPDAGVPASKG